MKNIIGLDRELRLSWLDLGAALARVESDKVCLRAKLMDALATDIPAPNVRIKTCTILIRVWKTVPKEQADFRDRAQGLLVTLPPNQRVVVHWGMLLLAYPFFREVVAAIGRTELVQGAVSRAQVNRRIAETWGERSTVKRSVNRVFQTLTDWQLLRKNTVADHYILPAQQVVQDTGLSVWMAEALLRGGSTPLPYGKLKSAPELFPFKLNVSISDLTRSGRFETFTEHADVLVGLHWALAAH